MAAGLNHEERALVAFYRGEEPNPRGYTFAAVLGWPDSRWEGVHDFIQWVFPNDQRSAFNPDAPLLTPAVVALWANDPLLQTNLATAFERWLRFAGVERTTGGEFRFAEPTNLGVWEYPNHNWLRITRVLKCLRSLHRADDATRLYAFLGGVAARRFPIDVDTLAYWQGAVL